MKNFVLILCCTGFIHTYSQKMIPGYILTEKGDSMNGTIAIQHIKNFSDSFLFVPTASNKKMWCTVGDCQGFGSYKPEEKYERWSVSMDMSYFDKDMYLINKDSVREGRYFLKNIYRGSRISLYYYKDPVIMKEHYFIRSGDSIEELVEKYREPTLIEALKPNQSPNYIIVYIFRNQLYKYFDWQHNSKLKTKVDVAEYFYSKMIAIARDIEASEHQ
jgi:hypothetical protein